ncbi:hypothetical protein ACG7TL_000500 [Trametes sanguinea]
MAGMGHSAATAALDQVPPGDRTEPVDVQNRRKLQKERHERCICMHMALRASPSGSPAPGHARLQCRGSPAASASDVPPGATCPPPPSLPPAPSPAAVV